ncbi:MAG TPA: hypothetical protein VKS79_06090 [Gemmataceae bacterium]|nr:hypothetical protein [Gemmataceae bacterium]
MITVESLGLLAYGPVPGMELIPYFLAMLAWVAIAIVSIFLSPITAMVRRLRKGKNAAETEPAKNVPPKPSDGTGPIAV